MSKIKIWVDDVRKAPDGYVWIKSTDAAIYFITQHKDDIELIDLDHDAGDYQVHGGDYINILNELEYLCHNPHFSDSYKNVVSDYKFRIHSANSAGVANMKAVIKANSWNEIL